MGEHKTSQSGPWPHPTPNRAGFIVFPVQSWVHEARILPPKKKKSFKVFLADGKKRKKAVQIKVYVVRI